MALNAQQVHDIARLAKLNISEQEIPTYQESLAKVLTMFEQLASANTEQVEPMTNPLDAHAILRPDAVTENNQREHFQQSAPLADQGYYLVPRVVE